MELGIIIFIIIIAIAIRKKWANDEKKEIETKLDNERKEIETQIKKHIDVLVKKRLQVSKDEYGNLKLDKWRKDIYYFINNTLNTGYDRNSTTYANLVNMVDDIVLEHIKKHQLYSYNYNFNKNMSPTEYEHYCASLLNQNGWNTQVTQSSGDQGVDVIATKNGIKLAVQCKKYNQPVGNKAVQEIYTAKSHIGADYAIVVTNNTYTQSAKELANTTGVKLLHHNELVNFTI